MRRSSSPRSGREFSGNQLPEENRTVALLTLRFERAGGDVPLGEVPPVLLAECRGDVRRMAETGTGFDPEWEAKTSL